MAALESFSSRCRNLRVMGSIAGNGLGPHSHGPVGRAITTRTYKPSVNSCGGQNYYWLLRLSAG